MNHLNTDGHETQKRSHERVEVIGRPLPALHEMAGELSQTPDISVYSNATSIIKGQERKQISEAEMIADLLSFCDDVKALPREKLDDKERALVDDVDVFVDSLHLLTHEAYAEAVEGLASRHVEWLSGDAQRKIRFLVYKHKTHSSQSQIAHDITAAILQQDEKFSDRVDVSITGELAEGLTPDTKLVLADDWAVSGNLIEQDISYMYKMFGEKDVAAPFEVNFLLARQDQVDEGVTSIPRLEESFPEYSPPESVVAYFTTPPIESIYGHTAMPTGSHSSADYGFSQTLVKMYDVLKKCTPPISEPRMPYAAEIIPTYSRNY